MDTEDSVHHGTGVQARQEPMPACALPEVRRMAERTTG